MEEPQAVTQLRDKLIAQGPVSYQTLSKKFTSLDVDKNQQLTKDELKNSLSLLHIEVSDDDLTTIFNTFDKGGDGKINRREFIFGIMPRLSLERRRMVIDAFQKADKKKNGIITILDMRGIFDPNTFQDYKDGSKTEEEVFRDFLKEFDEADNPDGKVTLMEFLSYYGVKGKDIASDEEFEKMLKDTWKLS